MFDYMYTFYNCTWFLHNLFITQNVLRAIWSINVRVTCRLRITLTPVRKIVDRLYKTRLLITKTSSRNSGHIRLPPSHFLIFPFTYSSVENVFPPMCIFKTMEILKSKCIMLALGGRINRHVLPEIFL